MMQYDDVILQHPLTFTVTYRDGTTNRYATHYADTWAWLWRESARNAADIVDVRFG